MSLHGQALPEVAESDGHELLRFLAGSPHRTAVLERLARSPATPAETVTAVDCSRTSVHRHLTALTEHGWVEKANGRYRLTDTGTRVQRVLADCTTRLASLDRFGPLLRRLDGTAPPDAATLADATLTVADDEHPYAPVDRYVDRLTALADREPTTLKAVLVTRCSVLRRALEGVFDAGATVDLVVAEPVVDDALAARASETPALSLTTVPTRPDTALVVSDEWALLGAHDGQGRLVATADGEADRFVSWCHRQYQTLGRSVDATGVTAAGDD